MAGLWIEQARLADGGANRLDGDHAVDVCIVGGGFTGLWTALHLRQLDPGVSVGIVEADRCGSGASGRNGGFVMSLWSKYLSLRKLCGDVEAVRLARASTEAIGRVGDICQEQGIDAGFRRDGWLWTATNEAQLGAWTATLAALEGRGAQPFEELSADEVSERAGSSVHVGGVYEAAVASVQPALVARALRAAATDVGIQIWERTPMVGLTRTRPIRIRTPTGVITAQRAVFAMNAWCARLRELRRRLVVIASDMVATPPGQSLADGWGGLCISDSRLLVNYFRGTADGRIAWGKAGGTLAFGGRVGASLLGASPRADAVAASMRRIYPELGQVGIASSWTGPIDRSMRGLPFFARLGGRPDLLVGAGYSGNGVGPSVLGGRILASMALDADDEWSNCGLVGLPDEKLPPEPARYVGGLAVRAAVERKEAAEDAGRTPGRRDRTLAGLAPAGLVPSN